MIPMLVVSAIAALGLLRLHRLAVPSAPPLFDQAAQWEQARVRAGRRARLDLAPEDQTWSKRAARWFTNHLQTRRPDDTQTLERDLAVTDQPMEEWLAKVLVWFLTGLFGGIAVTVLANALGFGAPLLAGPVLGLVGGVVLVVGEVLQLREAAATRREELCDALSDFLDLIVMSMEGGLSHADALPTVAQQGTGWAFETIHDAIDNARPNGMTPFEALGVVGDRFGITELMDLRASLNLAQNEGSSPRQTLIDRAQTMRTDRLDDAYGRANKSTAAMGNNLSVMALVAASYVILARVLFLFTA